VKKPNYRTPNPLAVRKTHELYTESSMTARSKPTLNNQVDTENLATEDSVSRT